MKSFTKRSLIAYPTGMPQPLQNGYSFTYVQNTIATKMQNGWTRKRQMTPYPFRQVTLQFKMSKSEFVGWHSFVHRNAFVWMQMELQTDRTGSQVLSPETVRFTGAASFSYTDWNTVVASVPAEIEGDEVITASPDTPVTDPDFGSDDGSSAGDGLPTDPSAIDLSTNPAPITYTVSGTQMVAFRTKPSNKVSGSIVAAVEGEGSARFWVSETPGGPAIKGMWVASGTMASFSWYQGGASPLLVGNSTYYFYMQATGGKEILVEFG